jgi:FkbM family methyltransferase
MFAKQVGTEGVVFAFEPIPQTFVLLQKNVALNDTDSIKALSVAAAANSGRTLMRSTDNPSMSSMIWHQGDPAAVEVSVRTAAIDDLVDAGELSLPKL